jgi:hypothetical protein
VDKSILEDISAAKQTVEKAESALDALLAKMSGGLRAEKVTISRPIEDALQRLHDAREILATLETDD